MKRKIILIISACFSYIITNAQVGINTTTPQEELHIAGPLSNIRIEGLNELNNPLNIGTLGKSRVFVNGDGDLVLGQVQNNVDVLFDPYNYLLDAEDGDSDIVQTGVGSGYEVVGTPRQFGEGLSQFTLTRNAIIELNYSLSWRIRKNNTRKLEDGGARIVQSFVVLYKWDLFGTPIGVVSNDLEGNPIILGGALGLNGQFYSNNDRNLGAEGFFHNVGTDYVSLGPGIYRPIFFAQIAVSNTNGVGAVKCWFGGGIDEVQIIAHYYN